MEPNRHRNGSPIDRKLSDGKEQVVGSRRQRLTARFLNGRPVGVVWCQFKSQSGNWKSTGWLINARGSDWKLRPSRVNGVHVQSTQAGWGHEGGMATDQADVTSLGSDYDDWLWLSSIIEEFEKWCCWWIVLSLTMATWKPTNRRSKTPGTGLYFRSVRIRDWWSPTGKKFQPPDPGKSHDYDEKQRKAA